MKRLLLAALGWLWQRPRPTLPPGAVLWRLGGGWVIEAWPVKVGGRLWLARVLVSPGRRRGWVSLPRAARCWPRRLGQTRATRAYLHTN